MSPLSIDSVGASLPSVEPQTSTSAVANRSAGDRASFKNHLQQVIEQSTVPRSTSHTTTASDIAPSSDQTPADTPIANKPSPGKASASKSARGNAPGSRQGDNARAPSNHSSRTVNHGPQPADNTSARETTPNSADAPPTTSDTGKLDASQVSTIAADANVTQQADPKAVNSDNSASPSGAIALPPNNTVQLETPVVAPTSDNTAATPPIELPTTDATGPANTTGQANTTS